MTMHALHSYDINQYAVLGILFQFYNRCGFVYVLLIYQNKVVFPKLQLLVLLNISFLPPIFRFLLEYFISSLTYSYRDRRGWWARFWFPIEKKFPGGSGLPVTAVTEKSRAVTGRIRNLKFEFKFLGMTIYKRFLLKFRKIQKIRDFLPDKLVSQGWSGSPVTDR
jgi:hypothetical protein